MKINLPKKILKNIKQINKIKIQISEKQINDTDFKIEEMELPLCHVNKIPFIHLINRDLEKIKTLQWFVEYKNNTKELIRFNSIKENEQELFNPKPENWMKVKKYLCPKEEKINILNSFNPTTTKKTNKSYEIKNKNLIYYSVYFDTGYVDLLHKSIESILSKSNLNFEFLIITDRPTKQIIDKLSFSKEIKINFLITKTPEDGWQASENKTKIFQYSKINDYEKILFLDCDIICVSDISKIFDIVIQNNILYTAGNENLTFEDHLTIHHGFDFLNSEYCEEMKKNNQMPFNSGQFLFKNSIEMKIHFQNIKNLLKNWIGEYFFEQCFMNYYFCKNNLTNNVDLNEKVLISDAFGDLTKKQNKCLIHLIKPVLDAQAKLNYINNLLFKKI